MEYTNVRALQAVRSRHAGAHRLTSDVATPDQFYGLILQRANIDAFQVRLLAFPFREEDIILFRLRLEVDSFHGYNF